VKVNCSAREGAVADYIADAAVHRNMAEEYRIMANARTDGLREQFIKLAEALEALAANERELAKKISN
jgi:hypothetical protein